METAIDGMLLELKGLGASRERLEASLVGGAHMFRIFDDSNQGVGAQNIRCAEAKLKRENIRVVMNSTGGNMGRNVTFTLEDGSVRVETNVK